MTRYQKHMQHIHNIGAAMSIESAVYLVVDDIVDLLVKSGIKADSELIKNVRKCGTYTYDPKNLNKTK
jgi:hypothetical protein